MSDVRDNGARIAGDFDALKDKGAFGVPIGTEWRREERANRAATPLDAKDAEGISGRDLVDAALKSVDAYKQARGDKPLPPVGMSPEFGHRAGEDVSAAWDHPAAAKAMRGLGASRIGMMDDVGRGDLKDVRQVLAAASDELWLGIKRPETPLTARDEIGINGREWMDRAKDAVHDISYMRDNPEHRSRNHTVESYREIARNAIADVWQHPEAAKAMRTAGATERGMQDDLNAGKTAKVVEGLSAPDPAIVAMVKQKQATSEAAKPQDTVQARRDDVRQAAADYRAKLMAAAPPQPEKAVQSETQGRRVSHRM